MPTRRRQEEFDEAERVEAEEAARWEAEERKRKEDEDRKRKEDEDRKRKAEEEQKEAAATDFDASGLSPARFKTRAENVLKKAKAASTPKNVISTNAAEDAVKKAIEFATKNKRDTMQGRLAEEARTALHALVSKIGQPPPVDPLEGPRAQLKTAAQRVAGRAKNDLPTLGKKNPRAALVASLRTRANELKGDASNTTMTNNSQAISTYMQDVGELDREIDEVVASLPLMTDDVLQVMGGNASTAVAVLAELRKGLSPNEITTIVPHITAVPLTVSSAMDLVAAAKVAVNHLPGGVINLQQLVPLGSLARIGNAILLAEHLNLALGPFVTNYADIAAAAHGFAPQELSWFVNVSVADVVALTTTFGSELPAFSRTVPNDRIVSMLNHHVPPARMKAVFATDKELLGRWGISTKVWTHLTSAKISKTSGEISGAHDRAVFVAYCTKLTTEGWTQNYCNENNTAVANVTRFQYSYTKAGKQCQGTKTVINGLVANQAAWRPRMEAAAWNCITNNGFQGATWTGTEAGTTWTGFFRKSMIDTIYPT